MHNSFGGNWTEQKLECLGKYLTAYNTALSKLPFKRVYIDLFAGSGKREPKESKFSEEFQMAFDSLDERNLKFFDGSTRLALDTEPSFHEFFFGEKLKKNAKHLEALKVEYPNKHIEIAHSPAATLLPTVLEKYDWRRTRAVLFLDPYGAQVDWQMLSQIADTKAIDVFYLFPSGLVISRLLKNDAKIPDTWRDVLNRMLGTGEWENEFYRQKSFIQSDLFGEITHADMEKIADIRGIDQFFINRLNDIFSFVCEEPLELKTSNGVHMFSLCFAIANPSPKAKKLARSLWKGVLKSVQK